MKTLAKFMFCLALLPCAARMGFSRGDKVIPQVADGGGVTTTFDLTNVSPRVSISNMWLKFYKNDGTPWTLQTNLGTNSVFQLSVGPRQTLRVQTSGVSQSGPGYAIIDDEETGTSSYSDDYVLAITVFYSITAASGVVEETVAVSVPQPTAVATIPIQIDLPSIDSGLAIVNLAGTVNPIILTLYNSDGTQYGNSVNFTLANKQKRSEFLDENLFPGIKTFKGMAEIVAYGPVGLLGLLQTAAVNGPQYATLAAVDKESLRRNTNMVLLQSPTSNYPFTFTPLDIDGFVVDYFKNNDGTEGYPWDLEYGFSADDTTRRYLSPYNGTALASLGVISDDAAFDRISLPSLKALGAYSTEDFDLSGSNLQPYLTFAVRTDLGNYAKVRIVRIVDTIDTTTGQSYKDLVLEVCVFK